MKSGLPKPPLRPGAQILARPQHAGSGTRRRARSSACATASTCAAAASGRRRRAATPSGACSTRQRVGLVAISCGHAGSARRPLGSLAGQPGPAQQRAAGTPSWRCSATAPRGRARRCSRRRTGRSRRARRRGRHRARRRRSAARPGPRRVRVRARDDARAVAGSRSSSRGRSRPPRRRRAGRRRGRARRRRAQRGSRSERRRSARSPDGVVASCSPKRSSSSLRLLPYLSCSVSPSTTSPPPPRTKRSIASISSR